MRFKCPSAPASSWSQVAWGSVDIHVAFQGVKNEKLGNHTEVRVG